VPSGGTLRTHSGVLPPGLAPGPCDTRCEEQPPRGRMGSERIASEEGLEHLEKSESRQGDPQAGATLASAVQDGCSPRRPLLKTDSLTPTFQPSNL
jgi:hypothetical protein